ncbi:MAG: mandelate racemase/muconate lactonizing enzyme family protein, partial [Planctomycetia bacterium]
PRNPFAPPPPPPVVVAEPEPEPVVEPEPTAIVEPAPVAAPTVVSSEPPAALPPSVFRTQTIEAIEAFVVQSPLLTLEGSSFRVMVKAVGSTGAAGWGEATVSPIGGLEAAANLAATVEKRVAATVKGLPVWDVGAWTKAVEKVGLSAGEPVRRRMQACVDMALHDLLARTLELPLHVWLGARPLAGLRLAYTVAGESPEKTAAAVRAAANDGFDAFKIKLGATPDDELKSVVRAAAEAAPRGSFVWIDAEQRFSSDVAVRLSQSFAELGVQAFEEPLRTGHLSGFRRMVGLNAAPVALDQSVESPAELLEYMKGEAVELPIVNLQSCGGYAHGRLFAAVARAGDLRSLGSGSLESDLGLAHSAQFLTAIGVELPVDLDGVQFVERGLFGVGVVVRDGRLSIPDGPGSGVVVEEDKVRAAAVR